MSVCHPRHQIVSHSIRRFQFSPERPITASISRNDESSTNPPSQALPSPPSYLGYLSGAISSLMPSSFSLTFGSKPVSTKKPVVVKTNLSGVPIKAVKADRVIERKISRTEVTQKTRSMIAKILCAESMDSTINRIRELSNHILMFPPTRYIAAQHLLLVSQLVEYESLSPDFDLRAEARQLLTLCGFQPRVKSGGINLLTIDGGGTRGMMGLAILEEIEKTSGKKICKLFDHICGVSTGGIIAALLGLKQYTVKEARDTYMEISRKLFSQNRLQGISGLITSHSYYDTTKWVSILKELIGEHDTLIGTSKVKGTPRISIIASIVNLPKIEPFVFRNYEHPAGTDSHYRGRASDHIWKALQSSAAAPFYFEEVQLGEILLQDGGVIANNPTAIAIHESKLLWPREKLHCVVSLGNGRSTVELEPAPTVKSTNIQNKISRIIDSATDTEAVHISMHDLLDSSVYYRLNPYMTFPYGLDEIDPDRLEQMHTDADLYVRRNKEKIREAAVRLLEEPSLFQNTKRAIYEWREKRGHFVT